MTFLQLASAAQAAEVDAGGGVDVFAETELPDGATWVGLRQVEGDVQVTAAPVTVRVDLDARIGVNEAGAWLAALAPEEASVTVSSGRVWLAAGIAPAPWRFEAVDGWDNEMATWSSGHAFLAPGSVLGARLGIGEPEAGLSLLAGLERGAAGWDLLHPVPLTGTPLLAGIHGAGGGDVVTFGGGLYAWPGPFTTGGLEAQARLRTGVVALTGEVLLGWRRASAATLQLDLHPAGIVVPALRGEWYAGQPGGALCVAVHPWEVVVFKVEGGYTRGAPRVAAEIAIFDALPPQW